MTTPCWTSIADAVRRSHGSAPRQAATRTSTAIAATLSGAVSTNSDVPASQVPICLAARAACPPDKSSRTSSDSAARYTDGGVTSVL